MAWNEVGTMQGERRDGRGSTNGRAGVEEELIEVGAWSFKRIGPGAAENPRKRTSSHLRQELVDLKKELHTLRQDIVPQKSSSDDKQEDYKGFHEAMRARTSKFSLGPSSRAVSLQQQIAWLENEYTRHVQSENKEYTMIFAEVQQSAAIDDGGSERIQSLMEMVSQARKVSRQMEKGSGGFEETSNLSDGQGLYSVSSNRYTPRQIWGKDDKSLADMQGVSSQAS